MTTPSAASMPLRSVGVMRCYVTCMAGDCGTYEIADVADVRAGLRLAREHAAGTGHDVCVDIERMYTISPEMETGAEDDDR